MCLFISPAHERRYYGFYSILRNVFFPGKHICYAKTEPSGSGYFFGYDAGTSAVGTYYERVVKKKCLTAGSLLCYKKGIVKECVQKNALFFYICLDYPIKSDNDRERKGGPLCVNKAVFLLEN